MASDFLAWLHTVLCDPNTLTAISTTAIAAFTAVLIWVGYCQARLIRKSIDLARDEYISTHRPRIVLREVYVEDDEIRYRLTNTGDTKATIVESWIMTEIPMVKALRPLLSTGHDDLGRLALVGGEMKDLSYQLGSDMLLVIKAGEQDGSLFMGNLYFVGTVIYVDEQGVRRRTVFRRQWSAGERRFVRLGPEVERDNEYAD